MMHWVVDDRCIGSKRRDWPSKGERHVVDSEASAYAGPYNCRFNMPRGIGDW